MTLEKFAKNNDQETVKILEVIYKDEITHVAAGLKWFTYICKHSNPPMVWSEWFTSNPCGSVAQVVYLRL